MDCFTLAMIQLKREGLLGSENEIELMIERAITIRNYLTRSK